jgi:hypothetical protein
LEVSWVITWVPVATPPPPVPARMAPARRLPELTAVTVSTLPEIVPWTLAVPAAIEPVTEAAGEEAPAAAKLHVPSAKLAKAFWPGTAAVVPLFLTHIPTEANRVAIWPGIRPMEVSARNVVMKPCWLRRTKPAGRPIPKLFATACAPSPSTRS